MANTELKGRNIKDKSITQADIDLSLASAVAAASIAASTKLLLFDTEIKTVTAATLGSYYDSRYFAGAPAANKMFYATASDTFASISTTEFGRGLLAAASGVKIAGLNAETLNGTSATDFQTEIDALKDIKFNPTSLSLVAGTLISGAVANLAALGGTDLSIQELSGANPLTIQFNFAAVTRFNSFKFYGNYNGGAGHTLSVEIWNPTSSTWFPLGLIGSAATKEWHSYPIYNPNDYLSVGVVQVRLRHIQNGIATHLLNIDYMDVADGGSSGTAFITASATSFTPVGNLNSLNVQAALLELDTEKEPTIGTKGDAFNKDFGTTSNTVLRGRTFGTAANSNVGDFFKPHATNTQVVDLNLSKKSDEAYFYYRPGDGTDTLNSPPSSIYGVVVNYATWRGSDQYPTQVAYAHDVPQMLLRSSGGNGNSWTPWYKVWTEYSDGHNSGLDADLLDGNHATAFATSSHTHGNLSNDGKIGSTANLPLITTTGGVVTVGSFGSEANTFMEGNKIASTTNNRLMKWLNGQAVDSGVSEDANGNVGIGTTESGGRLSLAGPGLSGDVLQQLAIYADLANGVLFDAPKNGSGQKLNYTFSWRGWLGAPALFLQGSNGNVGIGTTEPKSKLDVNGGVKIADDTDAAGVLKAGTLKYIKTSGVGNFEVCAENSDSVYSWNKLWHSGNLVIGGRNLVPNSATGTGWNYGTFSNGIYSLALSANTETGYIWSPPFDLKPYTRYKLRFKSKQIGVYNDCDGYIYRDTSLFIRSFGYPKSSEYIDNVIDINTNNEGGFDQVKIRFDHNGGDGSLATIYIKDVKLEQGSIATDWSPAPEDKLDYRTFGSAANYDTSISSTPNSVALRTADGDISVRELIVTSGVVVGVNPTSLLGIYPTTNQAVKFSADKVKLFLNYGTAANSATTDFIQNQNSAAQSANMWIGGNINTSSNAILHSALPYENYNTWVNGGTLLNSIVFNNHYDLYNNTRIENIGYKDIPQPTLKFIVGGIKALEINGQTRIVSFASTVSAPTVSTLDLRRPATTTVNYVFEGDSRTSVDSPTDEENWPNYLKALSNFSHINAANFHNNAVYGSNIVQAIARYSSQVYPKRPTGAITEAYLFVCIGINDITFPNSGNPEPSVSLFQYCDQATADGFKVVLFTIWHSELSTPTTELARLVYNNKIRAKASDYFMVVDMENIFPATSSDPFYVDTTHLTAKGNYLIASHVNSLFNIGAKSPISTSRASMASVFTPLNGEAKINGNLTVSGSVTEKYVSFMPTTIGWYRIISATTYSGGIIRIVNSMDNTLTDVEFQYSIGAWGTGGSINQTRFSSYNNGAVDQVRISSTNGEVFLDIHVYTANSPQPFYIYGYGQRQAAFVTNPTVGAVDGAITPSLIYLGHGFRTSSGFSGAGTNLTGTATNLTVGDSAKLNGQQGSYYQPSSTAITTSNISQQYVEYADGAGIADSCSGNAATASSATYSTKIYRGATNTISDLDIASTEQGVLLFDTFVATAQNKPYNGDNANGVISMFTQHPTRYGKQIAFGSNDDMYIRACASGTYGLWKKLLHEGNGLQLSGGTLTGMLELGTGTATRLIINSYNGTSNYLQIRLNNDGTYYGGIGTAGSQKWALGIASSGTVFTPKVIWDVAGNLTATDFITGSDIRLKTNIHALNYNPVDIEYKSFERKDALGKTRYGVIAQELKLICPELVTIDDKGMLSVSYIDLHSLEISNLKIRVKELEQQLNSMLCQ